LPWDYRLAEKKSKIGLLAMIREIIRVRQTNRFPILLLITLSSVADIKVTTKTMTLVRIRP